MTDMTTITKIRRKPEFMEIHSELELAQGRGSKATVLKCSDEPKDSFTKALDALERPMRSILELLPEQWDGQFAISGVTFAKAGEDGEGVVITASIELSASEAAVSLNTPLLPVAHLAEEAQEALEKVRKEAQAYLDGKRKGDLFAAKEAA